MQSTDWWEGNIWLYCCQKVESSWLCLFHWEMQMNQNVYLKISQGIDRKLLLGKRSLHTASFMEICLLCKSQTFNWILKIIFKYKINYNLIIE